MTLKLEVGKTYLTRNNKKVRVICIDAKSSFDRYPVIGLREQPGDIEQIHKMTLAGKYYIAVDTHPFDLIKEYIPSDWRWFNLYAQINFPNLTTSVCIYPTILAHGYRTKESLEKSFQYDSRRDHCRPIQIDITTGEVRL